MWKTTGLSTGFRNDGTRQGPSTLWSPGSSHQGNEATDSLNPPPSSQKSNPGSTNSTFPLKGRLSAAHRPPKLQVISQAVPPPTRPVPAQLTLSSRSLSASHWGERDRSVTKGRRSGPQIKRGFQSPGAGPGQVADLLCIRLPESGGRRPAETRVQR